MAEQQEAEEEERPPRLQLFSSPHSLRMHLQQEQLLQSSPLHTSASVPFRWEQHPGKPIHNDDDDVDVHLLQSEPRKKSLDLPPRLLIMEEDRSRLQSSSFRLVKRDWQLGSSFRRTESSLDGRRGVFSSFKVLLGGVNDGGSSNGGREVGGNHSSYVFPAYLDGGGCSNLSYDEEEGSFKEEAKVVESSSRRRSTEISRSGSFSAATKSHHFWATIYEGLKQVVPWRRRRGKKSKDRGRFLP
ncbi:Uncharacterized protein At4g00950 [Linum grandiflorum]